MTTLTARSVHRRYLVLVALRWMPVGLTLPVSVLLVTARGISLTQFGVATAAQGLVVLALELPTGGLADAVGRRPVLFTAAAVDAIALVIFVGAYSLAVLVVVYLLKGVSRALDSGPLDAWYVDSALTHDPDAHYERGLAHGTAVLSGAIASGALASGAIVGLGGIGPFKPLEAPIAAAAAVDLAAMVSVWVLMTETRATRGWTAASRRVADIPGIIATSLRIVVAARVLQCLLAVEVLWSFGMTAFEVLMPARLGELLNNADRASTVLGPVTSAAWVASATGAALIPISVRKYGPASTAIILRLGQGVTVAAMGIAGGPIGLIAAYVATYTVHGAANPVHQGLLHRQVTGGYRTTIISMNSMSGMPAGAAGAITLGWLADTRGLTTAMITGAATLAIAAPLYLPARKHDQPAQPALTKTSR